MCATSCGIHYHTEESILLIDIHTCSYHYPMSTEYYNNYNHYSLNMYKCKYRTLNAFKIKFYLCCWLVTGNKFKLKLYLLTILSTNSPMVFVTLKQR